MGAGFDQNGQSEPLVVPPASDKNLEAPPVSASQRFCKPAQEERRVRDDI
jgi:hypothetical protein